MKVIFYIVAICLLILFVGRTEISFNPFYIRMNDWLQGVGCLLITVGVVMIQIDARRIGYKEAQEDVSELLEDRLLKDKGNDYEKNNQV